MQVDLARANILSNLERSSVTFQRGGEMFKQRLFYQFLVLGFMGMLWLSSNPTLLIPNRTYAAAPSVQQAVQVTGQFCPFTVDELQTLHTVYYQAINVRMLETKDGPIGYDGGMFALSQCRISK
jgi:hypothetical protein